MESHGTPVPFEGEDLAGARVADVVSHHRREVSERVCGAEEDEAGAVGSRDVGVGVVARRGGDAERHGEDRGARGGVVQGDGDVGALLLLIHVHLRDAGQDGPPPLRRCRHAWVRHRNSID